jgi:putative hydrolases of HD superfamily
VGVECSIDPTKWILIKKIMKEIFEFIKASEMLKKELRHSWLSDGRQESVAEHSWRMSLMLMLIESNIPRPFDYLRSLKMAIVHDLVEIYAGDVPVFNFSHSKKEQLRKKQKESDAMDRIVTELNQPIGQEIKSLWLEYENNETKEARVVKALDKLEAQVQHNQAGLDTWEAIEYELTFRLDKYVSFNSDLTELKDLIVEDAVELYNEKGINAEAYQPLSPA